MNVHFGETDELSHDDGKAKNIILTIEGRRIIVPLSKSLADLTEIGKKLSASPRPAASEPRPEAPVVAQEPRPAPRLEAEAEVQSHTDKTFSAADSLEIQREDLVRVVSMAKGLSDAGGNELAPRIGVVAGGVYRVLKVNKTVVSIPDPTHPDNEPKMTHIINSIEAIDDKDARPERVTLLPHEVVLHKKRDKAHSVVKTVYSEFLKCDECGDTNALILDGSAFKGKCQKCGKSCIVERTIELCSNKKCVDGAKKRTQVSLFLYEGSYKGQCGTCKTGMEKKPETATA